MFAREQPEVNHEGKKVFRLTECPYAQLVCYQCINPMGVKGHTLGQTIWRWDCLLCDDVEFDASHLHSVKHLKRESYLADLDFQLPDVRVWETPEKAFYHDAPPEGKQREALCQTPAKPGGVDRVHRPHWFSAFSEDVQDRKWFPTAPPNQFDWIPFGYPAPAASHDFTTPANVMPSLDRMFSPSGYQPAPTLAISAPPTAAQRLVHHSAIASTAVANSSAPVAAAYGAPVAATAPPVDAPEATGATPWRQSLRVGSQLLVYSYTTTKWEQGQVRFVLDNGNLQVYYNERWKEVAPDSLLIHPLIVQNTSAQRQAPHETAKDHPPGAEVPLRPELHAAPPPGPGGLADRTIEELQTHNAECFLHGPWWAQGTNAAVRPAMGPLEGTLHLGPEWITRASDSYSALTTNAHHEFYAVLDPEYDSSNDTWVALQNGITAVEVDIFRVRHDWDQIRQHQLGRDITEAEGFTAQANHPLSEGEELYLFIWPFEFKMLHSPEETVECEYWMSVTHPKYNFQNAVWPCWPPRRPHGKGGKGKRGKGGKKGRGRGGSPRDGYHAGHEYPTNCCLVRWNNKSGPLIPGSDQSGFVRPQFFRLDRVPSKMQDMRIRYGAQMVYGSAHEPAQMHGAAISSILFALLPGFQATERRRCNSSSYHHLGVETTRRLVSKIRDRPILHPDALQDDSPPLHPRDDATLATLSDEDRIACSGIVLQRLVAAPLSVLVEEVARNHQLNPKQLAAMMRVQDNVITIVVGPPGTGKTTLIAALVDLWAAATPLGWKVAIVTGSNTAADNVVAALYKARHKLLSRPDGTSLQMKDILRVARHNAVNIPLVKAFTPWTRFWSTYKAENPQADEDSKATGDAFMAARREMIHDARVVVTTLETCQQVFEGKNATRPYIIIQDEAAQATAAMTMIPLQFAVASGSRVVMVGDPRQLPAVVRSKVAKDCGFHISLQEILVEHFAEDPKDVVMLVECFRCHISIQLAFNALYYGMRLVNQLSEATRPLVPGIPWVPVKHQKQVCTDVDDEESGGYNSTAGRYLSTGHPLHHRVLFAQVDGAEAKPRRGNSRCNIREAKLVIELVEAIAPLLHAAGITVMIVVPYKFQMGLLAYGAPLHPDEVPQGEVLRVAPLRKKKRQQNQEGYTEAGEVCPEDLEDQDEEDLQYEEVPEDKFSRPRPNDWGDLLERLSSEQGAGLRFAGLWARVPAEFRHMISLGSVESLQGGEADLVIALTIRANSQSDIGFIDDPRRSNVMLSRGRAGLIVMGSFGVWKSSRNADFPLLLDMAKQAGLIVHLAVENHTVTRSPVHERDLRRIFDTPTVEGGMKAKRAANQQELTEQEKDRRAKIQRTQFDEAAKAGPPAGTNVESFFAEGDRMADRVLNSPAFVAAVAHIARCDPKEDVAPEATQDPQKTDRKEWSQNAAQINGWKEDPGNDNLSVTNTVLMHRAGLAPPPPGHPDCPAHRAKPGRLRDKKKDSRGVTRTLVPDDAPRYFPRMMNCACRDCKRHRGLPEATLADRLLHPVDAASGQLGLDRSNMKVQALYVLLLLWQREPHTLCVPYWDASDVGDLPEAYLGLTRPLRETLQPVRDRIGARDGIERREWAELFQALQELSSWSWRLLAYARTWKAHAPTPAEWDGLTGASEEWPYHDAYTLIAKFSTPRQFPELDAVIRSDQCVLCALTVELFNEELGLCDPNIGGGNRYGGGLLASGEQLGHPPPTGLPLGKTRRPPVFPYGDNRFSANQMDAYTHCVDCQIRYLGVEGRFLDARMRRATPNDRGVMWGEGEASGESACGSCWVKRLQECGIHASSPTDACRIVTQSLHITEHDDPRTAQKYNITSNDIAPAKRPVTEDTPLVELLVDVNTRADLDPRKRRRRVPPTTHGDSRFGLAPSQSANAVHRVICDICTEARTWQKDSGQPYPGCFLIKQRKRRGGLTVGLPRRGKRPTKYSGRRWPAVFGCSPCLGRIWGTSAEVVEAILRRNERTIIPRARGEAESESEAETELSEGEPEDLEAQPSAPPPVAPPAAGDAQGSLADHERADRHEMKRQVATAARQEVLARVAHATALRHERIDGIVNEELEPPERFQALLQAFRDTPDAGPPMPALLAGLTGYTVEECENATNLAGLVPPRPFTPSVVAHDEGASPPLPMRAEPAGADSEQHPLTAEDDDAARYPLGPPDKPLSLHEVHQQLTRISAALKDLAECPDWAVRLQAASFEIGMHLETLRQAVESPAVLRSLHSALGRLQDAGLQGVEVPQAGALKAEDVQRAVQAARRLLFLAVRTATMPLRVEYDGQRITLLFMDGELCRTIPAPGLLPFQSFLTILAIRHTEGRLARRMGHFALVYHGEYLPREFDAELVRDVLSGPSAGADPKGRLTVRSPTSPAGGSIECDAAVAAAKANAEETPADDIDPDIRHQCVLRAFSLLNDGHHLVGSDPGAATGFLMDALDLLNDRSVRGHPQVGGAVTLAESLIERAQGPARGTPSVPMRSSPSPDESTSSSTKRRRRLLPRELQREQDLSDHDESETPTAYVGLILTRDAPATQRKPAQREVLLVRRSACSKWEPPKEKFDHKRDSGYAKCALRAFGEATGVGLRFAPPTTLKALPICHESGGPLGSYAIHWYHHHDVQEEAAKILVHNEASKQGWQPSGPCFCGADQLDALEFRLEATRQAVKSVMTGPPPRDAAPPSPSEEDAVRATAIAAIKFLEVDELTLFVSADLTPRPLLDVECFAVLQVGGRDCQIGISADQAFHAKCDCLVNAVSPDCLSGPGRGTLAHAAGQSVIDQLEKLPVIHPDDYSTSAFFPPVEGVMRCPYGGVRRTGPGKLSCRHILHAVAPRFDQSGPQAHCVGTYGVLMKVYESISETVEVLGGGSSPPIRTLGVPLLPVGPDRGGQPRDLLALTALLCTARCLPPSVHTVVVFARDDNEEQLLRDAVQELKTRLERRPDPSDGDPAAALSRQWRAGLSTDYYRIKALEEDMLPRDDRDDTIVRAGMLLTVDTGHGTEILLVHAPPSDPEDPEGLVRTWALPATHVIKQDADRPDTSMEILERCARRAVQLSTAASFDIVDVKFCRNTLAKYDQAKMGFLRHPPPPARTFWFRARGVRRDAAQGGAPPEKYQFVTAQQVSELKIGATDLTLVDEVLAPSPAGTARSGGATRNLQHFLGEDLETTDEIYLRGQTAARASGVVGDFGPWWCLRGPLPTPPQLDTRIWNEMGHSDLVRCAMHTRALGSQHSQSLRDLAWNHNVRPDPALLHAPVLRRWLTEAHGGSSMAVDGLPPQPSSYSATQRALADVVSWLVQYGRPSGQSTFDGRWATLRVAKKATAHGRDPRRHEVQTLDAFLTDLVRQNEVSEILRHPGLAAIRKGTPQPDLPSTILSDVAGPAAEFRPAPVPTLGPNLCAYDGWEVSDIPLERLILVLDHYRCMGRLAWERFTATAADIHQKKRRGRFTGELHRWQREDIEDCLKQLYGGSRLSRDFPGYGFCGVQRAMADAVNFLRKKNDGARWSQRWEAHIGAMLKTNTGLEPRRHHQVVLADFLQSVGIYSETAEALQGFPKYPPREVTSKLDRLWKDCRAPTIYEGDYVEGRFHSDFVARWCPGSSKVASVELDPTRQYGPVSEVRWGREFCSVMIRGWELNIWKRLKDSSHGAQFARVVWSAPRADNSQSWSAAAERATARSNSPPPGDSTWTPWSQVSATPDAAPRPRIPWRGDTRWAAERSAPVGGSDSTPATLLTKDWGPAGPPAKRPRPDSSKRRWSTAAPPHKDWGQHERYLETRRQGDRGDSRSACPVTEALPHFVQHLQRLDNSRWSTTYNGRWDRYNRIGHGNDYRHGVPTRDPFKKELSFLRDFVCWLRLADYFREFDTYWSGAAAGGEPGGASAGRGHERGHARGTSSGAGSSGRPRY